ncbi:cupin domain-containing protein [Bombilactobacillus thymidiniphilus]|uniref:Cupin domain-containing protein n=1 Tax=Bombilactobacillus thymidiniphilus TaxID=2923363 RepID=A0ABY4PDL8_9LACO|nr:cupin domain-containing protein [Bombilactobacillus thymidiniphilus]UQS83589.1 cupin domain-containing protein [Bombilactobacillus thymidiniphilus]
MAEDNIEQPGVFATGSMNDAYAQYFIGQSYNNSLVTPSDDVSVPVANVTFEPGCRNNWHIHHHGSQILLVTGGQGWYQEEGKPAQLLNPGDVVIAHDGVKHWHGATKDSWFSHLAITTGDAEWLEQVTDEFYDTLDSTVPKEG